MEYFLLKGVDKNIIDSMRKQLIDYSITSYNKSIINMLESFTSPEEYTYMSDNQNLS